MRNYQELKDLILSWMEEGEEETEINKENEMPCMCWYTPDNGDQKHFKSLCTQLVDLIKSLERDGDPDCCTLSDAHQLIDHLYHPNKCEEKE